MKKTLLMLIFLLLSSLLIAQESYGYVGEKSQNVKNISLKSRKHSFIGYTTNIPNQFLGFSVFFFKSPKIRYIYWYENSFWTSIRIR